MVSLTERYNTTPGHRSAHLRRLAESLYHMVPQAPPLGQVRYSSPLVSLVSAVFGLAVLVATVSVRAPGDGLTLALGGLVIFAMAAYTVRTVLSQPTTFSHSGFVHLGLALTLGPVGALTAALAETGGVALRTRNGWFRSLFNVSNAFLSDITAWTLFHEIRAAGSDSLYASVLGGLAAGVGLFLVNNFLLACVVRLANPTVSMPSVMRRELPQLPYNVGFGLAAFAFVTMHAYAGYVGFGAMLVPVILLHGFLVLFARRVNAYEEQRAAHQKEREELLHKAVEASESERRRIARDLHDGVVQNLAGMAYTLMATASTLKEHRENNGNPQILDVLEQSAQETRDAMKDLRTLIIEIAPPTLRREGLHAALLEILNTLKSAGVETRLELPSNMRLRQDRSSLIFRVAQEVLRNVAAHAEAKHVSVTLREDRGFAILQVTDDGKGFTQADVARRRAAGHVGTNAIVELAEEAGGTLTIDSEPGRGTRVTLTVPAEQ